MLKNPHFILKTCFSKSQNDHILSTKKPDIFQREPLEFEMYLSLGGLHLNCNFLYNPNSLEFKKQ